MRETRSRYRLNHIKSLEDFSLPIIYKNETIFYCSCWYSTIDVFVLRFVTNITLIFSFMTPFYFV